MADFKDKFKKSSFVQMRDSAGNLVEIPEGSVEKALKTGNYSFDPDVEINVVSPADEPGTIKGSEATEALAGGGFRLESASEQQQREKTEFFNQPEQKAAAIAVGAARGVSFGASDVLLTQSGAISPEYLQEQQENLPGLSGLSEVGGVVAGAVLPVGAAGAAVKGVSKAALAAEKALASRLGKNAVGRIAAKTGGFAAEGAAYGAGQALSEAAIEDKPLTAEALASSIGTGALLGGAFGGGFAGAGELASLGKKIIVPIVKPVADRSKKAFSKLTSPVENFLDVHGVNNRQRFLTETKYPDLPEKGVELLRRGHANGDFKKLSNTDDLVEYYEKVKGTAGKEIAEVSDKLDEIAKLNPQVKSDVLELASNVEKRFDDVISTTKVDTDLRKTLTKFKNNFVDTILKEPDNVSIKTLQELRREGDNIVFKRSKFGQDTDKAEAARLFTDSVRDEIDAFVLRAESTLPPEQQGQLFKRLKQANSDYHVAASWQEDAIRQATKKEKLIGFSDLLFGGVVGGAADSLLQGAAAVSARKLIESSAVKNSIILGDIQKLQGKFSVKLSKSIKDFFTMPRRAIRPAMASVLVNSPLGYNDDNKPAQSKRDAFANVKVKVEKFKTNPELVVENVVKNTTLLDRAAPSIAEGAVQVAQRAATFLSDKLPQETQSFGIFDKPFTPSDLELSQFERYLEGVEDPLSALEDIQDGTLTREKVDAISYVYPELYRKIQVEALDYVKENSNLPYQKKVQLGILLNIPTDSSLDPSTIAKLQETFIPGAQQEQPSANVKPNQTAVKNLKSSETLASDSQAFLQRQAQDV